MVTITPETAWKATLGELELQMTKATFNTWLKDTRLLNYENDTYIIGVRNAYAKDWLENRLLDTILRTLAAIVRQRVNVQFEVKDVVENNGPLAPAHLNGKNNQHPVSPSPTKPAPTSLSSFNNLTRRYTFSSFVVGASNRLAHTAALSVAENPGETYNPLFIYGGVGLGKTHLLQAIGNKCQQDGYSVCYISSETFTNDLIQSIRNKQMAQFRERYRTVDLLIIDDVQFIAGKESTQEELFHTFNELYSNGKQVVISSDRPPKAMVTLEERLQSRFEWGLMADIQLPDVETRKAILQAKAEQQGVYLPEDVMDYISQHIQSSIRELEGAFNKVMAYAQLANGRIDMELVKMALADQVRRPEKVSVEQVLAAVCAYYNVSLEALASGNREKSIAYPRQMAMYLARTETSASLPQIGLKLGNRDHSTVLYGYKKVKNLVETNASVRREAMEIKANLYESGAG